MKRVVLLIAIFTIIGLPNMVRPEDWYAFSGADNCRKLSELEGGFIKTPADFIKTYQRGQKPYKVVDDKVMNGRVVQVTVIDLTDYVSFTFYYGLDRCEKALKTKKAKQEKQDKELEKYK